MNLDQENLYSWLVPEKALIRKALAEKKILVGLCLGAQLIAESLGAAVGKHHLKEVGWHPVDLLNPRQQRIGFFVAPPILNYRNLL